MDGFPWSAGSNRIDVGQVDSGVPKAIADYLAGVCPHLVQGYRLAFGAYEPLCLNGDHDFAILMSAPAEL